MGLLKHILQIFIKAWETNLSRYGRSWGNVVRYVLVTCLIFILLSLIGYEGLGNKFTELLAAASAFIITAVLLLAWDLLMAPSRLHSDQEQEIKDLKGEIEPYKARRKVLRYLIGCATVLRNLEADLDKAEITPDEYMVKSQGVYSDLKALFDKSPYGDFLNYQMGDISSHNSLAPVMIDVRKDNLVKKLDLNDEIANKIAIHFTYRDNLDKIISQQSQMTTNNANQP